MNLPVPARGLIDVTCPVCRQTGRLRTDYRGEWVRCKRCRGRFEVPAAGVRLGLAWGVSAPRSNALAARMVTLGVAGPAAEEHAAPALRVYTG